MFRNLFILLFQLITNPTLGWKTLSEKQKSENEDFYKSYLFPIIGTIALLSFIGAWMETNNLDIQLALKSVLKQILTYGGGYCIASFTISEYLFPRFGLKKNKEFAEQFTAYASSVIFAIAMLESLFSEFFLLRFFALYTIYILWIGGSEFVNIKEEEQLIKFTFLASIPILFFPILTRFLICLLIPGIKI